MSVDAMRLVEGYIGVAFLVMGLVLFAAILRRRTSPRTEPVKYSVDGVRAAYVVACWLVIMGNWTMERNLMPDALWHAIPLWWHFLAQYGLGFALLGVALAYERPVAGDMRASRRSGENASGR